MSIYTIVYKYYIYYFSRTVFMFLVIYGALGEKLNDVNYTCYEGVSSRFVAITTNLFDCEYHLALISEVV